MDRTFDLSNLSHTTVETLRTHLHKKSPFHEVQTSYHDAEETFLQDS